MCDEENKNREKIEKLTAELSTFMQSMRWYKSFPGYTTNKGFKS